MSPPFPVEEAAAYLRDRIPFEPRVVLVLGSGLGHLAEAVDDVARVDFEEVPGFPATGVAGHAGRWVAGRLAGRDVLLQAGRYHVYEGHPDAVVAAPVRVAAALGARFLLLTNAAGGVDPALEPGDVVLVEDHINLMLRTPLVGPVQPREVRFPDMSEPYDPELRALACAVAEGLKIPLRRGVYAAVTGPSYETAAEVRMIHRLGAHVVGMSTVPEVVVARALGLRCLALSVVTNKGTGLSDRPLSHQEVVEIGARAGRAVGRILEGVVAGLPAAPQGRGAK